VAKVDTDFVQTTTPLMDYLCWFMSPQCVWSLGPSSTLKLIASLCEYLRLTTTDIGLAGLLSPLRRPAGVIGVTLLQELLATGRRSEKTTEGYNQ
jgi:hypothetical protein